MRLSSSYCRGRWRWEGIPGRPQGTIQDIFRTDWEGKCLFLPAVLSHWKANFYHLITWFDKDRTLSEYGGIEMEKYRYIMVLTLAVCFLFLHKNAYSAACPSSVRYGAITYNHQLLNQTIASGTYSQASGVNGVVGIKVSSQGVSNAGNNSLRKTIDLVYTTPSCDCLSDTAESLVTVTVNGSCSNGVLRLNFIEVYPDSSALVTCTGGDSCPIYTQQFIGSTNTFSMDIPYVDGQLITQPYTCPNCSGYYSWRLNFLSEPPPPIDIQTVPIAPLLHLMLKQENQ